MDIGTLGSTHEVFSRALNEHQRSKEVAELTGAPSGSLNRILNAMKADGVLDKIIDTPSMTKGIDPDVVTWVQEHKARSGQYNNDPASKTRRRRNATLGMTLRHRCNDLDRAKAERNALVQARYDALTRPQKITLVTEVRALTDQKTSALDVRIQADNAQADKYVGAINALFVRYPIPRETSIYKALIKLLDPLENDLGRFAGATTELKLGVGVREAEFFIQPYAQLRYAAQHEEALRHFDEEPSFASWAKVLNLSHKLWIDAFLRKSGAEFQSLSYELRPKSAVFSARAKIVARAESQRLKRTRRAERYLESISLGRKTSSSESGSEISGSSPVSDTPFATAVHEEEALDQRFADPIEAAQLSHRESVQLEGCVADKVWRSPYVNLVALQEKVYRDNGTELGERDVRTDLALIEITTSSRYKRPQILKYMTDATMNPEKLPVILFARNYSVDAEKALPQQKCYVVRSYEELDELLSALKLTALRDAAKSAASSQPGCSRN